MIKRKKHSDWYSYFNFSVAEFLILIFLGYISFITIPFILYIFSIDITNILCYFPSLKDAISSLGEFVKDGIKLVKA